MKHLFHVLTMTAAVAASGASAQTTHSGPPAAQAESKRPPASFPPPPGQAPPQQGSANVQPVQQSNFGPATYAPVPGAAQSQAQGKSGAGADGIAPLPPLTPPNSVDQAEASASPFTPAEIVRLRQSVDRTRKAKAYRSIRTAPRISSVTVDLSPGSHLPIARMMPGETSTLLFLDAAGAPWPLATAPRVSDNRIFDVEWLQGTATVVISALSPYEDGNLSVLLQGFATPVVVKLVTGEPDSMVTSRIVDYRLDLRIPGRAPGSPAGIPGTTKIALYDDVMQAFLDGLPPKEARPVKITGTGNIKTRMWTLDGALFVRTDLPIQTAFDKSMAAGDGTRVYRLPPTPFVTFSEGERTVTLQLDID